MSPVIMREVRHDHSRSAARDLARNVHKKDGPGELQHAAK